MPKTELAIWLPRERSIVPQSVYEPVTLVSYAVQLSKREQHQIAQAFSSGSFEMASIFMWTKAMAALRRRMSSLGMDFIGQMLGRPDITEYSSIENSVTEHELITLANDLGIVSTTEALRMKQTQELISHFAQLSDSSTESEEMTPEEAIRCFRTSIEAILGHQQIELPHEFVDFRRKLENYSFKADDPEINNLKNSPEFFRRATVSILLAQLQSATGAAAEHAQANTRTIIPLIWESIPRPLRWQIGNAYAELHNQGSAKTPSARALRQALVEVNGFDYVPETLRSTTYSAAAQEVLEAHESFGNFYAEENPTKHLASLGTSVPMPALPVVMKALLSVYLGNGYGHSYSAAPIARETLSKLDQEHWKYYVRECLPGDRQILEKVAFYPRCRNRWVKLVKDFELKEHTRGGKDQISKLISYATSEKFEAVSKTAELAYKAASPQANRH